MRSICAYCTKSRSGQDNHKHTCSRVHRNAEFFIRMLCALEMHVCSRQEWDVNEVHHGVGWGTPLTHLLSHQANFPRDTLKCWTGSRAVSSLGPGFWCVPAYLRLTRLLGVAGPFTALFGGVSYTAYKEILNGSFHIDNHRQDRNSTKSCCRHNISTVLSKGTTRRDGQGHTSEPLLATSHAFLVEMRRFPGNARYPDICPELIAPVEG